MAWVRPALSDLYVRISRDFSGRLLDGAPVLARSVVSVCARVWAGACDSMHGMLAWLFRQVFVDTAEDEYLERWAADWGMERKAASRAAGDVIFTGQDGAVIPAATLLLRKATGQQYALEADAHIADGQAVARVLAVEAGADGNLPDGSELSLIAPVAAVESKAVVCTGGISSGVDEESDASLRARLLARLRAPARGGSASDYVAWAREVPGVTRAWCYPQMQGIGTVGVCIVADDDPAGPLPSEELVRRVYEHIDGLRPVTVKEFEVFGPEPYPVGISLAIDPDTEEMRAAVYAELVGLFAREAAPGVLLRRSHISEAVSLTPQEVDHYLITPTRNLEMAPGVLPVLGEVSFVEWPE